MAPQLSLTDSVVTRRLSNTTTIASSTALADTVAASEGGSTSPRAHQQQQGRQDAAAEDGSGGRSTTQQQQAYPKASFSFVPLQDSGLSSDRQESCRVVLSEHQGILYELQHDELHQQPTLDPLLSRNQLQQQHDKVFKASSQKALLQAQAQQQQPPGSPSCQSFGSPFNSADKLPHNPPSSAAAAADGGSSDSGVAWDDAATESGIRGRDSSSSSADSTRMARQATLSVMLQLPGGSGGTSCSSSAANNGQLPGADAAEGVLRSSGSGSGSGLVRLYRSSSNSNQTLPTLFEGYTASRLQQQQQQGGHDQQEWSQDLPLAQVRGNPSALRTCWQPAWSRADKHRQRMPSTC
jgi:hypothetical protein